MWQLLCKLGTPNVSTHENVYFYSPNSTSAAFEMINLIRSEVKSMTCEQLSLSNYRLTLRKPELIIETYVVLPRPGMQSWS